MIRIPAIALCAFCLGSCADESRDFAYYERAEFNNMDMNIAEVESFVRDTAKRWGLQVFEVPKISTRGVFSMGAYVEGEEPKVVFWIGNDGAAHILSLMMGYEMGLSSACVDRLHEELKSGLESKLGIVLRPVDKFGRFIQENGG